VYYDSSSEEIGVERSDNISQGDVPCIYVNIVNMPDFHERKEGMKGTSK
jgi:hypothetical protein